MTRRWNLYAPISLALLLIVLWQTRSWEAFEPGRAREPAWLLVALFLDLVIAAGWVMRSHRLLASVGHPLSVRQVVPVVLFANTVAGLTPASAGEALRALVLRRRYGVPYRAGSAVILVERLGSLYLLAAWTLVAFGALAIDGPLRAPAALAGGMLALLPPIALARSPAGLAYPLGRLARLVPLGRERVTSLETALRDVEESMRRIASDPRQVAWFAAWTALVFAAGTAQLWAVAAALGATLDPLAGWAALGAGLLAGILSALPLGLGAADAVLVAGLLVAGVATSTAGGLALLVRAINNVPLALLGVASLLQLRPLETIPPEAPGAGSAPQD